LCRVDREKYVLDEKFAVAQRRHIASDEFEVFRLRHAHRSGLEDDLTVQADHAIPNDV
jgi:hypothetical protein